ncbi:MAG: response regulator [Bacteroidetes bacterium]|nr:MAG: response regulator [Bacteroidota bacterium]
MIKAQLSFLMLFLCFNTCLSAQTLLPDSLAEASIEEKVDYLNTLAQQSPNLDSALYYTQTALSLTADCDCDTIVMFCLYNLSFYPAIHGDFEKALQNIGGLDSMLSLKNNDYYTFRKHTLLAYAFKMKDQLDQALDQYKLALGASWAMEDSLLIADAHNNVGDAFMAIDLEDEAREYLLISLEMFDRLGVGENENRRFITYKNLCNVGQDDKEIEYYADMAYSIAQNQKKPHNRALLMLTQANAYSSKKYFEKCRAAAQRAFEISDSIEFTLVKNIALLLLGEANVELKKYPEAILNLESALEYDQDNLKNHHLILKNLSKAYAETGRYRDAFNAREEMGTLSDSINSLKTADAFAEFDVKFKTEQKDKEIAQQQLEIEQQKNARNRILFGGISILLLATSLFGWYYNRSRRKKQAAELALELKQQEAEKLRELDQLKSRFFTNISHELRTPLTLISGPLEDALEKSKSQLIEKDLRLAHNNSKKLLTLINEILDLSKLESGKLEINQVDIQLNPWLKRVFFSFESLAKLNEVQLDYESNISMDLWIKADAEKLEKVINNLLSNAIKFSPNKGIVKMRANNSNGNLVLAVSDQGQGIPEEERSKIFERFYQSSQTNVPLSGGTGVGLALARELARLFGGDLTVKSQIGVGSTFTLDMPLAKGTGREKPTSEQQTVLDKTSEEQYASIIMNADKSNILIVEDNPEMSAYLQKILSEKHQCTLAKNGLEALELVQKNQYDLITSDVMMPGMDGFAFRQKLNNLSAYKNIPFIMLTARALEEDKLFGLQLGVDDYITKPFNARELMARVNNLLQNKKERELWLKENSNADQDIPESAEKKMLKTAESIVLENLDNSRFKVNDLARELAYSQRQLTRVIKKSTGMTPVGFILELRLQKAYQLLKNRQFLSVSEVMFEVGIESLSYFSTKFSERFGHNPKELLEK